MFLILLAALLLRNFNILNNNQQPCQPSPSQRSEGGQGVVVDNGHSSFAADTIHSEGAHHCRSLVCFNMIYLSNKSEGEDSVW